jgi:hypothetical protein
MSWSTKVRSPDRGFIRRTVAIEETAQRSPADATERVRGVRERFTAADVSECQRLCVYHQVDWPAVARLASDLVQAHGVTLTAEAVDAAAETLDPSDRRWLSSLFDWPIKWHPTSPTLTDGQHRACGLVLGGAERVPVWQGPVKLAAEEQ